MCHVLVKEVGPRHTVLSDEATNATVHLVGVAHLSPRSNDDVRRAIREVRPNDVALELCSERTQVLHMAPSEAALPLEPLSLDLLRRDWRQLANPLFWLVQLNLLAVEALVGTGIGAEQQIAAAEAQRVGAECLLIDRRFSVTVARCLGELCTGGASTLRFALLASLPAMSAVSGHGGGDENAGDSDGAELGAAAEALRARVMLLGMQQRGEYPWPADELRECRAQCRALVDRMVDLSEVQLAGAQRHGIIYNAVSVPLLAERDEIMAHHLWRQVAKPGGTVVAVVGKAHVPGITRHFGRTTDARCEALQQPPPQGALQSGALKLGMLGLSVVAMPVAGLMLVKNRVSPRAARTARLMYAGVLGLGSMSLAATGVSHYNFVRRLQLECARTQPHGSSE